MLVAGAALIAPPVRAAVAEWLNIGGVQAQPVGTGPSAGPPCLECQGTCRCRRLTGRRFRACPQGSGGSGDVDASKGLVAMSWDGVSAGAVQGAAVADVHQEVLPSLEFVQVVNGYWFSTPHELVLDDERRERVVRVAGPTLVWVYEGLTFRLEGVEKAKAVELASGTS